MSVAKLNHRPATSDQEIVYWNCDTNSISSYTVVPARIEGITIQSELINHHRHQNNAMPTSSDESTDRSRTSSFSSYSSNNTNDCGNNSDLGDLSASTNANLTIHAKCESPLTVQAKGTHEYTSAGDNEPMEYHKNMARHYPGSENWSQEQIEFRLKNSRAARVSRAKAKVLQKQREQISKAAKCHNSLAKRRVATFAVYLNKLHEATGKNEKDWMVEWKLQKEGQQNCTAEPSQ